MQFTRKPVLREILETIPTHRLKLWVMDAHYSGYITQKPDCRSRKSMQLALNELTDYQLINLMGLINSI